MGFNEDEGVVFDQPTLLAERLEVAREFVERTNYRLPLLVDRMGDEAMEAYAAWPERLYAIRADGSLGFKGGMGPMLFSPSALEAWLAAEVGEPDAEQVSVAR